MPKFLRKKIKTDWVLSSRTDTCSSGRRKQKSNDDEWGKAVGRYCTHIQEVLIYARAAGGRWWEKSSVESQ
jgi:hypothetical protein